MLFDHQPTRWDLRFRIFGFPVRVHPLCWLGLAILGQFYLKSGFDIGLVWMACAFVSLLWHELGHAFVMRKFGSPVYIELFAFGGHAVGTFIPTRAWRRLLIAVAGPAAGLLLCGAVWLILELVDLSQSHLYVRVALRILFIVNLIWSLLNLLPVWPMDGGHILRELLVLRGNRYADLRTHQISIGVAAALILLGTFVNFAPANVALELARAIPSWLLFAIPSPIMCIFLGMMAYQNYTMMKATARPRIYRTDDRVPWER